MAPYLTRKHTSSNTGEVRSKGKDKTLEVASKTKNVDKTSRLNGSTKVKNPRSNAGGRKTRSSKNDVSILQSSVQKEKRERAGRRKLTKKDTGSKVKLGEIAKDSGATKEKSKVKTRRGKPSKNVSNSKQMSLKESFLNQSKRKFVSFQHNSKNDKSEMKKKKLPIYRRLLPESSRQSTSEIYEFKVDPNDTKLPKRRKKRGPNKATLINRKKRNVPVKRNLQEAKANAKKEIAGKIEEPKKTVFIEPEAKNSAPLTIETKNSAPLTIETKNSAPLTIETKNSAPLTIETKNSAELTIEKEISAEPLAEAENSVGLLIENEKDTGVGEIIETAKADAEAKDLEDSDTRKEEAARDAAAKPTVTSVETLKAKVSILDSSQISNADNFKPFRPTNIFSNRLTKHQRHALNYSLFEQSLSPVKKTIETPQISSPWRASPLLTFSQVRNVFQSTPQTKHDVVGKKFPRPLTNDPKPFRGILKVKSNAQRNNENMSPDSRAINTTPKKKNPLISRKFGTEITNVDKSLQPKSPAEQNTVERMSTETENIQPYVQSDSSENKRSTGSSPRKTPKKKVILVTAEVHQENTSHADEQKENLNPQPGPSGLQTRSPLNEQRVLRQSNLNNFLNIPEMPQSSAIVTSHGIFDDTQSTSVTLASPKPPRRSNTELKNAFGFNDGDFDQEISPNEKAIQTDIEPYDTRSVKRMSIGQIRNLLLVKQSKEDARNKENVGTEKKTEARKPPVKKRKQPLIDVSNFSDTFDLQSEGGETSIASESNIPLFADYEPSRFTQPPRYSYKRKRAVRFSFSEGDSEEEDPMVFEQEIKRKRTNKLKTEQEKRAKEWVKNINRTFDEIDEYELLIE